MDQLKNPIEVERIAKLLDATHINHEFVLYDNLDINRVPDQPLLPNHPIKIVGWTILFCLSGASEFSVNLSQFSVKFGDAIVMIPGSIIEFKSASPDLKFFTIAFSTEYYDTTSNIVPHMQAVPVISLGNEKIKECLDIYFAIEKHIHNGLGNYGKNIIKGYVDTLLSILISQWQNKYVISPRRMNRPAMIFQEYLQLVRENYSTKRLVSEYADMMCITPKYLSKVIKGQSGKNASEFIDEMVILEAKALLKHSKYSIKQVSEKLNFPNPSFFSKFFKAKFGMQPSAYRKGI